MNRKVYCALLAAVFTAGPLLVGCDDTVSRTSETKVKDDGTVVRKEQKVTENSDGTVTKTESKKVDKPGSDGATIKVDVDKK